MTDILTRLFQGSYLCGIEDLTTSLPSNICLQFMYFDIRSEPSSWTPPSPRSSWNLIYTYSALQCMYVLCNIDCVYVAGEIELKMRGGGCPCACLQPVKLVKLETLLQRSLENGTMQGELCPDFDK